MSFVKRCLRIRDIKHPFNKRCKNNVEVNGVLCSKCMQDAKRGKIYMLMHNEVTKKFKIPFKNQIYVEISLASKVKRPESYTAKLKLIQNVKNKLRKQLNKLDKNGLKYFHDKLNLNIWSIIAKKTDSDYSFNYWVSDEIINCFIAVSNGSKKIG